MRHPSQHREGESRRQNGIGILGMRFRARAIGGHLTIESAADAGTVVRLSVPTPDVPPNKEPHASSTD